MVRLLFTACRKTKLAPALSRDYDAARRVRRAEIEALVAEIAAPRASEERLCTATPAVPSAPRRR